jgi:hypothetical protein
LEGTKYLSKQNSLTSFGDWQPFESAKKYQYFLAKETSFEHPSLVASQSWTVDSMFGQTKISSDPPFHVGHSGAIY